MNYIPIFKPTLPTYLQVSKYLKEIDETQIYSNRGPLVKRLEEKYARYCNVERNRVVALSNATLALQGLITNSGINNWIIPDFTFAATAVSVLNSGKRLILADIDCQNWTLQVDSTHISKETGVVPVMPFGAFPNLEKWTAWENVIVDAAASLGSGPFDFSSLPEKWSVVFSLHATKVLGAGEGALVITGSELTAKKLRAWSNFGFNDQRHSVQIGTNAKMSEVSAAYALASLELADFESLEWSKVQNEIQNSKYANKYWNVTYAYPGFNPYWIIQFENKKRTEKVIESLHALGIASRRWWPLPISEMKLEYCEKISSLQKSKHASETILGLPKFRGMDLDIVEKVYKIIETS